MDSPTNDGTCDAHPVTDEPFIDVRETHTAVVVLAGDRAFKAKKPVVTDFCDSARRNSVSAPVSGNSS